MSEQPASPNPIDSAFQSGRSVGFATAAVALSVVAFLNLLGLEKSLLAGVLALLALQGHGGSDLIRQRGRAALLIAIAHAVTVIAVLALFHDRLIALVHLLQKLG